MLRVIYWISVVTLILLVLSVSKSAIKIVERKHPQWVPSKHSSSEVVYILAVLLFSLFCPIWNTLLVFLFIGNYEELIKRSVEGIEKKYEFIN